MEITLAGTRPTRRAPKENFTGTVLQDPMIMAPAPARLNCLARRRSSRARAPTGTTIRSGRRST